jgi:hypothetical protein
MKLTLTICEYLRDCFDGKDLTAIHPRPEALPPLPLS